MVTCSSMLAAPACHAAWSASLRPTHVCSAMARWRSSSGWRSTTASGPNAVRSDVLIGIEDRALAQHGHPLVVLREGRHEPDDEEAVADTSRHGISLGSDRRDDDR